MADEFRRDHGRARSTPAGSRRPCALGDAHDGLGGVHALEPKRLADMGGDGALRRLDIERGKLAADRPRRH